MSSLLIEGGRAISGKIAVEGNKNAALPLLAACLLTTEECVLTNMPRIGDVGVMAKLLEEIGAEVHGLGTTTVRVRCRNIKTSEPSSELVGKLRGSVLLLGPLLARTGRAVLGMPGGDFPARRTIGTHIEALVNLGATVLPSTGHALEAPDGLHAASMYLDEASVTGHRDGAACRGDDRRGHGNPPRRDRTARRRGLHVPSEHGSWHHGRRLVDDSCRGHEASARRHDTSSTATTSKRAAGRWWQRSRAARSRCAARARRMSRASRSS